MGIEVILNVYDLIPQNEYMYSMGIGAYHSGVQLFDTEYSFGRHEIEGMTGVFECPPKSVLPIRESIILGEVNLSSHQINDIIYELKPLFTGTSYHPLKRNCNHFSDELCKRLLNKPIPGYVNRLAYLGTFVQCFLPQEFQNNIADEAPNVENTQQSRFPGTGGTISNESISPKQSLSNEDIALRRERHARAAMQRMQNNE